MGSPQAPVGPWGHSVPRATCMRGCDPVRAQWWGGAATALPGSHSISAPQGHSPSSCPVPRGELGLWHHHHLPCTDAGARPAGTERPRAGCHGLEPRARALRGTRPRRRRWGHLRTRGCSAWFATRCWVPFPPAAPSQPDPEHGAPHASPVAVGRTWAGRDPSPSLNAVCQEGEGEWDGRGAGTAPQGDTMARAQRDHGCSQ